MKKNILLLFAALLPLVASAEKVEIDGIWYNLVPKAKQAEVTSSDGTKYSGSITIPATVTHNGVAYSVTSIGISAFYNCTNLTDITIPEGVTSIGNNAFYFCSSLTDITIPEGVTSIGNMAFYECSSLTTIICEATTPPIVDSQTFNNVNKSIPVYVPAGSVEAYKVAEGWSEFTNIVGMSGLIIHITLSQSSATLLVEESLTLTATVAPNNATDKTLTWSSNNPSVATVDNIGKVTAIASGTATITATANDGSGVSDQCEVTVTSTAKVEIDGIYYNITSEADKTAEVTYKGDDPYQGRWCSGSITIPATVTHNGVEYSVTSIGEYAFCSCSSLTAITLPEGVTSIGEYAFLSCSSLTDITLPEGVTSIGDNAFCSCSSLTAITLPESVTSIGERAFAWCESLTAITILASVTSIGSYAFSSCSSLKELTLGKGIKKIAVRAFNSCTALEKVTIYATRPPSIEGTGNAFFSDATYENATLYVPQGCIDKYQVMTGWSSFYTIEEMEGGTPNYLTLRQADNGEVGIVVEPGRTYKVRITAFEGWEIHSVTFNGEEVTAQLTEEGTFTTPTLQADAVLNIAYEKNETPTTAASAQASRIKVQGHQGTLRITGTTEGDDISVYTTDGTLVTQESAEDSETLLTLSTSEVYIVTVGDKVVKIGM